MCIYRLGTISGVWRLRVIVFVVVRDAITAHAVETARYSFCFIFFFILFILRISFQTSNDNNRSVTGYYPQVYIICIYKYILYTKIMCVCVHTLLAHRPQPVRIFRPHVAVLLLFFFHNDSFHNIITYNWVKPHHILKLVKVYFFIFFF